MEKICFFAAKPNKEMMKLYASPLQGFTEAPWRNLHHALFGGVDAYYTPFVRIEKGEFRNKDIRDIAPENNRVPCLVPQLIASVPSELERLVGLFAEKGYREADINMGCPFPLLTGRHKGSGILPYPSEVKALLDELAHYPEMDFSVKMRLGWEYADEWKSVLPLLNKVPLSRVILHPRVGHQQYKGSVNRKEFALFYEACSHPLVFNGDLLTADDIRRTAEEFPRLEGFMLGRGLLAHPALAAECKDGKSLPPHELCGKVKTFHERLFGHYAECLQGEAQLLSKIKPYWEYLLPGMDRKLKKAILKATRVEKYLGAVNVALQACNEAYSCPRT